MNLEDTPQAMIDPNCEKAGKTLTRREVFAGAVAAAVTASPLCALLMPPAKSETGKTAAVSPAHTPWQCESHYQQVHIDADGGVQVCEEHLYA